MHTITALANKASLPRRTVQYWHDKGVLQPLSKSPVVYSDAELKIVRLLSGFGRMSASIAVVHEMARIFRLILARDSDVPGDVLGVFDHAEKHGSGFMLLALDLLSDGETPWARWTAGVQNYRAMPAAIERLNKSNPSLHITIIDVGYALNLNLVSGSIYPDEKG